jgi:RNA polymerase sigma factor (sigma-70 family)
MSHTLEENVKRIQQGDQLALEELIAQVQGKVYGLALRTLWHPEDARDATQEILLRVVTHLATFRSESSFSTWVYRIAANHLLRFRKSRVEKDGFTFETFGKDLEEGLADTSANPDDSILFQEIRVGCTLGMLLCLDRPHRLAYILGEILEIDGNEAAGILAVKPVTLPQASGKGESADRGVHASTVWLGQSQESLPMPSKVGESHHIEASRQAKSLVWSRSSKREDVSRSSGQSPAA